MSTFAPCVDCSGEVVVGQLSPITVPRLDEDGFPMVNPNVEPLDWRDTYVPGEHQRFLTIQIQLPVHRADTFWARQTFDPTGLAPALCEHGLPPDQHPLGLTHPFARSWIRAKYLDPNPFRHCPVCRSEERPADMTTARP